MKIEVLYGEICNLFGDWQNATYLRQTLPEAEIIETPLENTPCFVTDTPDLIYIGSMTEANQRRAIKALQPHANRLKELIENGTAVLATGNGGEILMKQIDYVTEKIKTEGLGIVDLTVKTDLFDRFNGKVLGRFEDMDIVGFQSQFSTVSGDNTKSPFLKVERGVGCNRKGEYEGWRYKNLFVTSLLGPLLPLNPLFTEYLIRLAGEEKEAAFRPQAMAAYEQRLKEFKDPKTVF